MYNDYGTPVQKPQRTWLPKFATVVILGLLVYQVVYSVNKPVARTPLPTVGVAPTSIPLPTDLPDYFNLGNTAFDNADYLTAIADYTHILEFDQSDSEIFSHRGDAYYHLADYAHALADYNRALELAPSGWLYNNRGLTYAALGEDAKAIADYRRALNADDAADSQPADHTRSTIYYNRGIVYYGEGNYEAALKDFNKAIELKPDYARAYFKRGLVYQDQNNLTQALLDYNKSLEYDPTYPEAYNNRGLIYHQQGDYLKAIADYTQSLNLNNPEQYLVYVNRGLSYLALEKYALAKSNFDRALRANPTYPYAYNNRGWASYLQGNYAEAIADYEHSLEYGNPEPWIVYDNLALAFYALGDTDKAFEAWDNAQTANYQYADLYRSRGDAYFDLGELDKAQRDYRMYEQFHGVLEGYMAGRMQVK